MSTAASKGGPNLANMRENYVSEGIYENDMPDAPHILMSKWIDDACSCKEVSSSQFYDCCVCVLLLLSFFLGYF